MSLRYFGRNFTPFQQILVLVLVLLIVLIAFGTAAAFLFNKASPAAGMRRSDPLPVELIKQSGAKTAVYTGIGQLRALTADKPPVSLVVTPYFPYPETDNAFYEEIVKKNRKMRVVILDYFSHRTQSELMTNGELAVKDDLLKLLNGDLIMGQISQLYFTEYGFF